MSDTRRFEIKKLARRKRRNQRKDVFRNCGAKYHAGYFSQAHPVTFPAGMNEVKAELEDRELLAA